MDCSDVISQIDAWLDGELPASQAGAIAEHVAACERCGARRDEAHSLRHALHDLPYHTAPAQLRARLADAAARSRRSILGSSQALAAAAAIALFAIGLGTGWRLGTVPRTDAEANQVVASHIRSLLVPDHLTDVQSSDRHTVKPWFAGRLSFAPPVDDLADAGFPLIGGRVDYVDDRPVAAIVYGRRQHRISLFLWPAEKDATAVRSTERGYHLEHWAAHGMSYWLVSDAAPEDLDELRRHLM